MPRLINLNTYKDNRGALTVIEKDIPFLIKRVFYIYDVDSSERGRHKHKKTIQALIMVSGSCSVFVETKTGINEYKLSSPSKCLILNPEDYHWMNNFSEHAVLLVLASEEFNINDYIFENDSI